MNNTIKVFMVKKWVHLAKRTLEKVEYFPAMIMHQV